MFFGAPSQLISSGSAASICGHCILCPYPCRTDNVLPMLAPYSSLGSNFYLMSLDLLVSWCRFLIHLALHMCTVCLLSVVQQHAVWQCRTSHIMYRLPMRIQALSTLLLPMAPPLQPPPPCAALLSFSITTVTRLPMAFQHSDLSASSIFQQ